MTKRYFPRYVEEAVNSCYQTDAEIKDSAGLQEFLAEIGDPEKGNLPPFRWVGRFLLAWWFF